MVLCRWTPKPTKRRRNNNHKGEKYLRRSVPWRTAGFVTTCLSLWKVELEKGESNNHGVTVVSRHASGGPCELLLQGNGDNVTRKKLLGPQNRNGESLIEIRHLWCGMVWSELMITASWWQIPPGIFFLEQTFFINRDFQSRENR